MTRQKRPKVRGFNPGSGQKRKHFITREWRAISARQLERRSGALPVTLLQSCDLMRSQELALSRRVQHVDRLQGGPRALAPALLAREPHNPLEASARPHLRTVPRWQAPPPIPSLALRPGSSPALPSSTLTSRASSQSPHRRATCTG